VLAFCLDACPAATQSGLRTSYQVFVCVCVCSRRGVVCARVHVARVRLFVCVYVCNHHYGTTVQRIYHAAIIFERFN